MAVAVWVVLGWACSRAPQELPVAVSASGEDRALQWRDARGPLSGEVPWVIRSDLRGPDTALVVETPAGRQRARRVSFRVLAGQTTEYAVSLVRDDAGRVRWNVGYGEGQKMRLFSCDPRPAVDRKNECIHGGIPKPLLGTLVGDISAELDDGSVVTDIQSFSFERVSSLGGRTGADANP